MGRTIRAGGDRKTEIRYHCHEISFWTSPGPSEKGRAWDPSGLQLFSVCSGRPPALGQWIAAETWSVLTTTELVIGALLPWVRTHHPETAIGPPVSHRKLGEVGGIGNLSLPQGLRVDTEKNIESILISLLPLLLV